jgi:RNA polymerase sigma-70 factor (sigma-E family)
VEPETGSPGEPQFSNFVAARYSSLLRTAFLLTGDRGIAEDLVQSALMRAYPAWRRSSPPDRPELYVRTIMIRLATRWRARHWRGEVATDVLPERTSADAPSYGLVDSVRSALLALPMEQRAVLVLRFYEQYSEQEIAQLLGVRPGTVKSRGSRGIAALRTAGLLGSDPAEDARPDREAPHV